MAVSKLWIKLYVSILDDPKLADLPDNLYRIFINLLAIGGRVDQYGKLGTVKEVAYWLRNDPDMAYLQLTELQKVDITCCKKGVWSIKKWDLYQSKPPSASKEAVRERVRKSREYKAKADTAVTSSNVVTGSLQNESNDPRIEENREEKNRTTGAPTAPGEKPDPVKELATVFEQASGIKLPKPSGPKSVKQIGVLWWLPLKGMVAMANGRAPDLLRAVIAHMRRDGLTLSSPNSALKVFTSMFGETQAAPVTVYKDYS